MSSVQRAPEFFQADLQIMPDVAYPLMSGRTSAELGAPLSKSRTSGGSPQGPCILQDLVHGILRFPIMLGQAMYIDLLEPLVIAAITERQEYQLMPPMS